MRNSFIHIISFYCIYSGCGAKDSNRKVNLITVPAKKEPNREKTKKEDVAGKPKRNIPGKTHTVM